MSELIKFYEGLIETLDLETDSDGTVKFKIGGVSTPMTVDDKLLCLPTRTNIETASEVVNGKTVLKKVLFNPLSESAVGAENTSFIRVKEVMELKLLGVIYQVGETLFSLVNQSKGTDNITDMNIAKFISTLNRYKAQGIKTVTDNKTISNWVALCKNIMDKHISDSTYVKFYVKRGGVVNGITYDRTATTTFPLLEGLLKHNPKNGKYIGVELRNKDIHTYKSLFEFIFGKEDVLKDGISTGSLNKVAPAMHSLLMAYSKVCDALDPILESLNDMELEEDVRDKLVLKKLPMSRDAIGDLITDLKKDITLIPNDNNLVLRGSKPIGTPKSKGPSLDVDKKELNDTTTSAWGRLNAKKSKRPEYDNNRDDRYDDRSYRDERPRERPVEREPRRREYYDDRYRDSRNDRGRRDDYYDDRDRNRPAVMERRPARGSRQEVYRDSDPWAAPSNRAPSRRGW